MNMKSTTQAQTPASIPMEQLKETWAEDPMVILVMLFDKTLLHISQARATLTGWSNDNYQTHILKAIDVIEQLQLTLNMDAEGAMANNLNDIYHYIVRILVDSVSDQKPSSLNHASDLLMQIRQSLSIFVKKSPKVLQH